MWAGPAEDLFNAGNDAYGEGDYAKAAENYEKVVANYGSSTLINDVKLRLGVSYLYLGKYPEAVAGLKKLTEKGIPPEITERALYYLGLSQMSQASGVDAGSARQTLLNAAITNFTQQMTTFPKSEMREDVLYNRALANFFLGKYDVSETDFVTLNTEFSGSVNKADYVFWQGRTYAARVMKALTDKKKDEAQQWSQKAMEIYGKITDADNPVVANDARMESAELDFFLTDSGNYQKVIDEYNKVHRTADLIPVEKARIESIRIRYNDAARAGNKPLMDNLDRLRTRELSRLNELQGRVDPAIKAGIRKAQCYVRSGRYDEARVLLRRVQPYVSDAGDKKDVFFQRILAYALQKQTDKANSGLDDYLQSFPGDKEADVISYQIGNTFMEQGDYQQANNQYDRSLKDFPKGRYVDQVTLQKAAALSGLRQTDKAMEILANFIAQKPNSPNLPQAQYVLASTKLKVRQYDEAANLFSGLMNNPQAGNFASSSQFQLGYTYFSAGKYPEALQEFRAFIEKNPQDPLAGTTALYIGMALDRTKSADAIKTLNDVADKYPEDLSAAPYALNYIGSIYDRAKKFPEMVAAYGKVYEKYPQSPIAAEARRKVGDYYNRMEKYDDAAKMYDIVIQSGEKISGSAAAWAEGDMWYRASKKYGAYSRSTVDEQKDIRFRLDASEKAFLTLLKQYPQSDETGRGLQGLLDLALQRVEFGLLQNEGVGQYFATLVSQVDDPALKARVELLQAAVPYAQGRRADALAAYKKVLQDDPNVQFSPFDARCYGDLLLENNEVDAALDLFTKLQQNSNPNDKVAQSEVHYGLGMVYFAKQDYEKAGTELDTLIKQFGFHPNVFKAQLVMAQTLHQLQDKLKAKVYLVTLSSNQRVPAEIKARAMIEMGDILMEEHSFVPVADKSQPNAAAYYAKAEIYFGDSMPDIGGEALWKTGQAYENGKKPAEARKQYEDLVKKYGKTAYAGKAAERLKALPAAPAPAPAAR